MRKLMVWIMLFMAGSHVLCVAQQSPKPAENFFDDGIEMVEVKGGTFMMGCTSEQGKDCFDEEKQVHRVTLSDFYIGKYEVTQKQWQAVTGSNPSWFKEDNLPVERVSWNDVQEFIRKLNVKTGKSYRLPTEAEWEYAARGGAQSRGTKYSGSNTAGDVAWYYTNSGDKVLDESNWNIDDLSNNHCKTHPVGQKLPNELGLYDMSGNVLEWCGDWGGDYDSGSQTDPAGPSSGSGRLGRGGSWVDDAQCVRVSLRNSDAPDNRNYGLGFRLVCGSK